MVMTHKIPPRLCYECDKLLAQTIRGQPDLPRNATYCTHTRTLAIVQVESGRITGGMLKCPVSRDQVGQILDQLMPEGPATIACTLEH